MKRLIIAVAAAAALGSSAFSRAAYGGGDAPSPSRSDALSGSLRKRQHAPIPDEISGRPWPVTADFVAAYCLYQRCARATLVEHTWRWPARRQALTIFNGAAIRLASVIASMDSKLTRARHDCYSICDRTQGVRLPVGRRSNHFRRLSGHCVEAGENERADRPGKHAARGHQGTAQGNRPAGADRYGVSGHCAALPPWHAAGSHKAERPPS
jgi:hypothetical protein